MQNIAISTSTANKVQTYLERPILEEERIVKKLYVGNLSYQMTEESLREVFSPIGEVLSAKIITDAATGRSKGFGFVEMASDEEAAKAISDLNGTNVMDRAINVSEARPQTERARGGAREAGGGRGGQRGFDRSGSGSGGGRKQNNWR